MPDIRHGIRIDAQPARIFELVSTGAGIKQWWAEDLTESPASGSSLSALELGFFGRKTVYKLSPLRAERPLLMEWRCDSGKEWSGTHLRFEIEPQMSGAILRFAHTGWAAETDYFRDCNKTWDGLVERLKHAAEGENPGPLFSASGVYS